MSDTANQISERELLDYQAYLKMEIFRQIRQRFAQLKKQGFTQKDLALKIGMDEGQLSRRLRGEFDLRLETLSDLARGLECRIDVKVTPISEVASIVNQPETCTPGVFRKRTISMSDRIFEQLVEAIKELRRDKELLKGQFKEDLKEPQFGTTIDQGKRLRKWPPTEQSAYVKERRAPSHRRGFRREDRCSYSKLKRRQPSEREATLKGFNATKDWGRQ
jgi:transcriptional regulator with XRE-family HTH domain